MVLCWAVFASVGVLTHAARVAVYDHVDVGHNSSHAGECIDMFPKGFKWAVATAAYQVEGAVAEGGRTPSIWDTFCKETPNMTCADTGNDMYHKYKDDIKMMKELKVGYYRFSFAWSRVMKWNANKGRAEANPEGVTFYTNLIHELRRNHIDPLVTLYHWDMPMFLEDAIQGWLGDNIAEHFRDYSEVCFTYFGHLVPMWFTMNEPWTFGYLGYGAGVHAPGQRDSETMAYKAAHNVLLAHGESVKLYREMRTEGKVMSRGQISIVLNADFGIPVEAGNDEDITATEAYIQYVLDWFLHPIVKGSYPPHMVERAGSHLPTFTEEQKELVMGTLDDNILGLNHYTTKLITECDSPRSKTKCEDLSKGWALDLHVDSSEHPPDARKSPKCVWHAGWPTGYGMLMDYVYKNYPDLKILLTESGWCGDNIIDDLDQLWYYKTYVAEVLSAIKRGVPVLGYTAWSVMDNYEWGSFNERFGLWYVDFNTLERVPKTASFWFAKVVENNCLDDYGYCPGNNCKNIRSGTELEADRPALR
jgi:beta-glucosidase